MGCRKAPSFGKLLKFILAITTRRVSEVQLAPRLRFFEVALYRPIPKGFKGFRRWSLRSTSG